MAAASKPVFLTADVARELKTQTIDLIKYEKLGEYRAYVCSEHFVADTRRLVKEDLPSLALSMDILLQESRISGSQLSTGIIALANAGDGVGAMQHATGCRVTVHQRSGAGPTWIVRAAGHYH